MFVKLPTNEKGQYSFHDMQAVILKERERRVRQLCLMPCDRGNERLVRILRRALRKQKELEASGGICIADIERVAKTGVDRISMGALTHTVVPADLGLDMLEA